MAIIEVRSPIEVDVTYVNKTWFSLRKQNNLRHYVIGVFQRHGKAIIDAIPNNDPETIEQFILTHIEKGALVYCEENILPSSLKEFYEVHELKATDGHAKGDLHINNVKNLWKDLKRQLKRTHVQVSQKHLQGYCSEVAWRSNTRHLSPMEKFNQLLSNCSVHNKETSYKNIIK